ncbi:sulfatase-like hydrolase/transferase [Crossiella sp. SN42]|uniref:sulfatase-like hydrolase/transferase n=1 Tax=Crossiella sp. SN42 TaxID=2944808 RepID=UPI00207D42DF|nr:sulfatase-like hydrolase/transferase [Crossiella sp. SN42]MCO1574339.1 sulfatase-like hydrolase/transferase [Crossiella sp. SN42]
MPAAQRPNIVLVLADDLGYGDLGHCNGHASRTTALDQLCAEGIALTQHYSAAPVCAPARAALLTGRYPHRTGAIDTLELRGLDRLALRERTLADSLAAAGYRTGLVGKWHNGALDERYHPNRRGFAEFTGFRGGWQDYWQWRLERNGVPFTADGRHLTDVITAEAISFLRRHRGEPFFLHVAYNAPHFPFQAPQPLVEQFTQPGRSRAVATIYAMIHQLDHGIATLREELSTLGLADNTIFLFSSDNGPQLDGVGEESTRRHNCGLAGAKESVHEGGIRVPLLLSWPDGLPGGVRSDVFAHFTDWFPTLVALAGAQLPEGVRLDGIDLADSLRGQAVADQPARFWQWNRLRPLGHCNAAMRDGRWKLVRPALAAAMGLPASELDLDADLKRHPERYPHALEAALPEPPDCGEPPRPQLFDLLADPGEEHDLAARHPALVVRMEAELGAWFEDVEQDRRSIRDC